MENEGINKRISLGGVVRNTSESTCNDGEFEELTNLRYKDGRFVPMSDNKDIKGIENTPIPYSYIYVHSNRYQHFIGYKDGTIWYFADMDDDGVVTMLDEPFAICQSSPSEDVGVQYTQTGNIVTIIDGSELKGVYWRDGKYVVVSLNQNGSPTATSIPPEGLIQLRVARKDFGNGYNTVRVVMSNSMSRRSLDETSKLMLSQRIASRGISRLKGEPTGHFYVCTAVKLYDGSYILQSRPVLINPLSYNRNRVAGSQENISYNMREFAKWTDGNGRDAKYNTSPSNEKLVRKSEYTSGEEGVTYYECSANGWSTSNFLPDQKIGDSFLWIDHQASMSQGLYSIFKTRGEKADSIPDLFAVKGNQSDRVIAGEQYTGLSFGVKSAYTHYKSRSSVFVVNMPQVLQYRINYDIDDSCKDLIQSVCVFMTEEVEPFSINDDNADFQHYNNLAQQQSRDPVEKGFNPQKPFNVQMYNNDIASAEFNGMCVAYPNDAEMCKEYIQREEVNMYQRYMIAENCKPAEEISKGIDSLKNFYKVCEIPFEKCKKGDWVTIDMEEGGVLKNLVQQERLNVDSSDRSSYSPKASIMFNGRLHIANYTKFLFSGFPIDYFYSPTASTMVFSADANVTGKTYNDPQNFMTSSGAFVGNVWRDKNIPSVAVEYTINSDDGVKVVTRYSYPDANSGKITFKDKLNPIISFPDNRCEKVRIIIQYCAIEQQDNKSYAIVFHKWESEYDMTAHETFNLSYYRDSQLNEISTRPSSATHKSMVVVSGYDSDKQPYYDIAYKVSGSNQSEYEVNGLKISAVDNPMYFPVQNTYRIGNQQIVALATNAVKVSEGQVGDMPLYVFANDGIYGLFVDSTGEVCYATSRMISRDICNNWKSVTYTDAGVAFVTDRGLKMISGSEVNDISDPLEGKCFDFVGSSSPDKNDVMKGAVSNTLLVNIPDSVTNDESSDYFRGCIVGYNHRDKEIWVSNPDYTYSYIFGGGIWYKRTISCNQYIQSYPETYMLAGGRLTQLGVENSSGSEVAALTRAIKFDTHEFKQAYRTIVRGKFGLNGSGDTEVADVYSDDVSDVVVRNMDINEYITDKYVAEANSLSAKPVTISKNTSEVLSVTDVTPQEISFTTGSSIDMVAYEKALTLTEIDKLDLALGTNEGTLVLPEVELTVNQPANVTTISRTTTCFTEITPLGFTPTSSSYCAFVAVNSFSLQLGSDGRLHVLASGTINPQFTQLPSGLQYGKIKYRASVLNAAELFTAVVIKDGERVTITKTFSNGMRGHNYQGQYDWNTDDLVASGMYFDVTTDYVGDRIGEYTNVDTGYYFGEGISQLVSYTTGGATYSLTPLMNYIPHCADVINAVLSSGYESRFEVLYKVNAKSAVKINMLKCSRDKNGIYVNTPSAYIYPSETKAYGYDEVYDLEAGVNRFTTSTALLPSTYTIASGGCYDIAEDGTKVCKAFRYNGSSQKIKIDDIKSLVNSGSGSIEILPDTSAGNVLEIGASQCFLKLVDNIKGTTSKVKYVGSTSIKYADLRGNIDDDKYETYETSSILLSNGDKFYSNRDGVVVKYIGSGGTFNSGDLADITTMYTMPAGYEVYCYTPSTKVCYVAGGTDKVVGINSMTWSGESLISSAVIARGDSGWSLFDLSVQNGLGNVDAFATSKMRYGVGENFAPSTIQLDEENYKLAVGSSVYHVYIKPKTYFIYEVAENASSFPTYYATTYITVSEPNKLADCTTEPAEDGHAVVVITPGYTTGMPISYYSSPSFTLSDLINGIKDGTYDIANAMSPSSVKIDNKYVKISINGTYFYVEASLGTYSYSDVVSNISDGTWTYYGLKTDSVNIRADKCYTLTYNVGGSSSTTMFVYKGADTSIQYKDLYELIDDEDSSIEVVTDAGYSPEYVDGLADGELVTLYETTSKESYTFVYSGGDHVSSSILISNAKSGGYSNATVTMWQDDMIQLNKGHNTEVKMLDGSVLKWYNYKDASIGYARLLSGDTPGDETRSILTDKFSLTSGKYYHITYTDGDGEVTTYDITYDGPVSIYGADLIDNLDAGAYEDIPDKDINATVKIPSGIVVKYHATDSSVYTFKIDEKNAFYMTIGSIETELDKGLQQGTFVDTMGVSHQYELVTAQQQQQRRAGVYVFGSYDLRKWQFLGGNELSGSFRDIGCLVERVDCKYFRIMFVGNLTGDSEVDYIDMSVISKLLTKKTR